MLSTRQAGRAIARSIVLLALCAVSVAGCTLDQEQAAQTRALLEQLQTYVAEADAKIEVLTTHARDAQAELDRQVAAQEAAADRVAELEIQLTQAVATGDVDAARSLRAELNSQAAIASSDAPRELRDIVARVNGHIDDLEDERAALVATVEQLSPTLVGPDGSIDWGGTISALAPAATAIPGWGAILGVGLTALGGFVSTLQQRQKKQAAEQQVVSEQNAAMTLMAEASEIVASIDRAKDANPDAWQGLRHELSQHMTAAAKSRVRQLKQVAAQGYVFHNGTGMPIGTMRSPADRRR